MVGEGRVLCAGNKLLDHLAGLLSASFGRLHSTLDNKAACERLEERMALPCFAAEFSVVVVMSHGGKCLPYYLRMMPKLASARFTSWIDLGPRPSTSRRSFSRLRARPPTVRMFAFSRAETVREESSRSSMRVFMTSAEFSDIAGASAATDASGAASRVSSRKPTTDLSWMKMISIDCSRATRGES